MAESTKALDPPFYITCTDFLQQGDIFRVGIVTPLADAQPRLFRAGDGRHGSVVFSEGSNGRIFERAELDETLDRLSTRTPLHTRPFRPTDDGQLELVVVFAGFSQHFVIVTQTCDVSGHDRKELPFVMILPARTLMEICQTEPIQLQGIAQRKCIEEYINERVDNPALRTISDAVNYSETLRKASRRLETDCE